MWSPGHNSFFTSPDGTQVWNAYHAYAGPLDGLLSLNFRVGTNANEYRTTRVQQVGFDANGVPVLGVPSSESVQLAAPSGDKGLTSQFEGAPVTIDRGVTVGRDDGGLRRRSRRPGAALRRWIGQLRPARTRR